MNVNFPCNNLAELRHVAGQAHLGQLKPSFEDVTTSPLLSDQPSVRLVGMGAMGKMYVQRLSDAGW